MTWGFIWLAACVWALTVNYILNEGNRMTENYEMQCYKLACYVAPDNQLSEDEIEELSAQFQAVIKDYLQARQNAAEAAYDRQQEEPTFRGGEYAADLTRRQAEAQRLK